MPKIATLICLSMLATASQASWLSCKLTPANCTAIQGVLIPFGEAESIIEDCQSLTRDDIGATALRMTMDRARKIANNNRNHPLLRAQLAYGRLHDSPLRFDRNINIEQRYPHVRRACSQAFADMNE
ncbi:hypothetical protein [Comamonas thiooxydans]|uniref:hypothetical protein n=1 Tax=Comamonas thiooxydans TaxID=363952 RepID=UPI000B41F9C1|nr:hypothetical protein [Comamonas thiooxydans]